jgi:hypothetical protein
MSGPKRRAPPRAGPRLRRGELVDLVAAVLAEHPNGLRTVEVRKIVQDRLGRQLGRSTARSILASVSSDGGPSERVAHGRYRLLV